MQEGNGVSGPAGSQGPQAHCEEPSLKAPRLELSEDPDLIGEQDHFLSVSYSIAGYADSALEIVEAHGSELHRALSDPENRRLWNGPNPEHLLEQMRGCVELNQRLLDELVQDLGECPVGPPGGLGRRTPPPGILQVPEGYAVDGGNASKTRSTLRQFVRDWAREGERERAGCYGPLLQDLAEHLPLDDGAGQRQPRVLTPGSGLGRLTFEVARRGYFAEGNEFSYHMLLGTCWVLNDSGRALSRTIYPSVLDTANRRGAAEHLRPVLIPDVCPLDLCNPSSGFGKISMRSGEFGEVYKEQVGQWDAVLTAFFLDTAHNVFQYIRIIAAILRPGGLWSNLGPLLWHYSPTGGGNFDAVSIELSWEEVRPAIEQYFVIRKDDRQDAQYTDGGVAGKTKVYHCVHFYAVRNGTPVTGNSNPVWSS